MCGCRKLSQSHTALQLDPGVITDVKYQTPSTKHLAKYQTFSTKHLAKYQTLSTKHLVPNT